MSFHPGRHGATGPVVAAAHPPVSKAGRPLPDGVRSTMEGRYGQDFSRVRVHDDQSAAESARQAGAKAFTVGTDIVFGASQFRPETSSGSRLLTHELAHVVQHRSGRVSADAESRADDAAAKVLRGGTVDTAELGGAPEGLARQPEDGGEGIGLSPGRLRAPILATFDGFAPNSATLSAADQRSLSSSVELIRGVALRTLGRIVLSGHTTPGEPESLGGRRTLAIAHALVEAGVLGALIDVGQSTRGGRSVDVTISSSATPTPHGGPTPASPDLLHPRIPPAVLPPPRDPYLLTTPLPPGAQLPAECRRPVDPSRRFTGTRVGTPGDAVSAVSSVPEIKCALLALQELGLAPLRRLPTGQRWGLGLGLAGLFLPPLTIAIVQSQAARDLAVQGLGSALPVGFSLGLVPVQIQVMGQLRPRDTPAPGGPTAAPPPDLSGPVSVTVPALVPRNWLAPGAAELRLNISVDLLPVIDRVLYGRQPESGPRDGAEAGHER
ncbi:MAG: DUF4157 domain-containing protein [Pseudonocardiaceae bacterium]